MSSVTVTNKRQRKPTAYSRNLRQRLYQRPMRISKGINWKAVPSMHYPFIQTHTGTAISSNIAAAENNYAPTLDMLAQYTTFQALFDAYRIMKVEFTFIPRANTNESPNIVRNAPFYTAIDNDDVAAITTIAAIQQYQTLAVHSSLEKVHRVLYPKVATDVYQGVSSAYSEAKNGLWLDCGYPSVPHYGLRTMFGATGTAGDVAYDVILKFFIEFKTVR